MIGLMKPILTFKKMMSSESLQGKLYSTDPQDTSHFLYQGILSYLLIPTSLQVRALT